MARTSSKIVKSIPASEEVKVECLNSQYIITQNLLEVRFTLWKCLEDGFEKLKTSDNPKDFDDIIPYEFNN